MRKLVSSLAILALVMSLGIPIAIWAPPAWSQQPLIEPVDPGLPQELVVNDQRYSIDMEVPINSNPMEEAAAEDGTRVLVKPGQSDPLAAVYVPASDTDEQATRYLPQYVEIADATCPSDQVENGSLSGDGVTWIAAAPEMDVRQEELQEIGQTDDGRTLLGLPGDDQVQTLFVANNSGQGPNSLVRYVQVNTEGSPVLLEGGFTFAGQEFTATPGGISTLDGMVKVGCAGLFPIFSPAAEQPYTNVALAVNGQPASFEGQPPAADPAGEATAVPSPDAEPTEEPPTEVPPTAVPPTEVPPTEVPPTEVPPTEVPPTEVPPTEVPTTEVPPTEVPPTEVPPTEVPPTEVPPTEVPPTEVPATESPPTEQAAPDADQAPVVQDVPGAEEGEVLPTAVPPTPDPAVPTPTPATPRPTPTPVVYQAPATVATAPPQSAPTAAVQPSLQCVGVIGSMDIDGVPDRLPRQLQYAGQSWSFAGVESGSELGDTREISCVGPFVVLQQEGSEALYLGIQNAPDTVFAFQRSTAFTVTAQTRDTQAPNRLAMPDTDSGPGATYRAGGDLAPTSYSSTSMVLYVTDPEASAPDRIFGHSVSSDAFGEFVPEEGAEPVSQDVAAEAEGHGIPAQMLVGNQRYVLVSLWTPFGTTTNGWMTLFGIDGQAEPEQLIGLDPRRNEILIFNKD